MLGALVLGCALKQSGTKHDTDDVPVSFLKMLSKFWYLRSVPYVDAVDSLFYNNKHGRFAGVFTKLHVCRLVLDIDVAILCCLDNLFNLPAPAALRRAMSHYEHGARIDCKSFFAGMDENWYQSRGCQSVEFDEFGTHAMPKNLLHAIH